MAVVEVGVLIPLLRSNATPTFLRRLGQEAEARGFSSLWVGEHVVMFDEYDSVYPLTDDGRIVGDPADNVEADPFTSLAYLAACTSMIRLGTGVCVLPQRNPVYTAKEAASVDALSGGRLNLGIGLGWLREEYGAVGVDWSQRGARCDSYIRVMKALWCDDPSVYRDAFYDLPSCRFGPKPAQSPHPPLYFGGWTSRMLDRIVEHGQGWLALALDPTHLEAPLNALADRLRAVGRDRSEVAIAAAPYPHPCDANMLKQYADLGVDEVILADYATEDNVSSVLDRMAELKAVIANH